MLRFRFGPVWTVVAASSLFLNVAWADDPTPPSDAPLISPFTGPQHDAPQPPASLARTDLPELGSEAPLEKKLIKLESEAIVTIGSKRAQRVRDVPLTVAWIPAEELEGTGQFTLCDAIQFFPGMECRRGAMRKAVISSRGLGSNFLSNRLLLLKDGRPDVDPWTGIFYPDETTPLTNLKQIEVIRGPGSSLYGSNAFSGVINMVERRPDDVISPGQNVGADLRLLAGQNDTARAQATAAGKIGDLKGLLNYYGFTSDGAQLLNDPSLGITDHNEWTRMNQVSAKAEYKILRLNAEYNNGRIGRPGGIENNAVGNCGRCHYTPFDSEKMENINASAQVDAPINDWLRVFAQGYAFFKRREVSLENQLTGEMQPVLGKRRRLGAEARAVVNLDPVTITVGADGKDDLVNNRNVLTEVQNPDGSGLLTEDILGLFADGEWHITPRLILGAGFRYDYYQMPAQVWHNPSGQISPRASLVFHLSDNVTLRANYGHAFRAPTLAELAISQQMYASTLLGNPELKAETMDTFEGAVDLWLRDGTFRVTGTGFYNLAQNFINEVYLGGITSQFQNIGNARVGGAELEASAQVKEINSSFDLAYQYLRARAADGSPLDYAPSGRIYARGRTRFLQVAFAEAYVVWVDARQDPATVIQNGVPTKVTLPPYLVANARIGLRVTDRLSVSLLGQNIFNAQYQETYGFPMPGTTLYGELKFVY